MQKAVSMTPTSRILRTYPSAWSATCSWCLLGPWCSARQTSCPLLLIWMVQFLICFASFFRLFAGVDIPCAWNRRGSCNC